ncbi:MAG: alpha,alpha-trehalase TreF [Bacteroidota bacterium]
MKKYLWSTLLVLTLGFTYSCRDAPKLDEPKVETKKDLPPNERFGELFEQVQMQQVFPDGKTFVDCTPKFTADEIMSKYEKAKGQSDFDLEAFVLDNFEKPKQYASGFQADTSKSVRKHINSLWPILTRQPDADNPGSLIGLPNEYIVPGGRFGEIYYWDSYFTMLGLQVAGKTDMIENMVKNFAYIIDKVGFIPNGNRTYFLTRSQPPFFARMVQTLAEQKGDQVYAEFLPQLTKEYNFWMDGVDKVSADSPTYKKVVRLPNGTILNRYWDKGNFPRAESYREDVETIEESDRPDEQVFSDLRAACESGWDFSSRWFGDPMELHTIETTHIIPVDLNALLYNLEMVLAKGYSLVEDNEKSTLFQQKADNRKAALLDICWSAEKGYFLDYNFIKQQFTKVPSLAGMYPLTFKMATAEQAKKSAAFVKSNFLMPGGVVSTLVDNGQQWDYPNGWAPLQWMTIEGLRHYDENDLAKTIKDRWVALNTKVYKNTGKLVEKYNVVDLSLEAGGGEYPVQDGFGWTNGVLLRLISEPKD